MSNKQLFTITPGKYISPADTVNEAGGKAYKLTPKQALLQLVMTGTFNDHYYKNASDLLTDLLTLLKEIDDEFIEKAAIYSRQNGKMKDMPSFLTAYLSCKGSKNAEAIFHHVIDNGRMIRNFVQMVRSGQLGRKSLGSRMKRLLRDWITNADPMKLMNSLPGKNPSLAKIFLLAQCSFNKTPYLKNIRNYIIGLEYNFKELPSVFQRFILLNKLNDEKFNDLLKESVPGFDRKYIFGTFSGDALPYNSYSTKKLTVEDWRHIATIMPMNTLRQNLNNLNSKKVFERDETTKKIIERLSNKRWLNKITPYTIYSTYKNLDESIPMSIRKALNDSVQLAYANIEVKANSIVVGIDVSGSMSSSITGKGVRTSNTSCNEVASLIACAYMYKVKQSTESKKVTLLPFDNVVRDIKLDPLDTLATNAQKIAASGGRSTDCSAPLRFILEKGISVDLVIIISDNESWIDKDNFVSGRTESAQAWINIKLKNPNAKLININLAPYGTTQISGRDDILNIGGFADEIFDVINKFVESENNGVDEWVKKVEEIYVNTLANTKEIRENEDSN